MNYTLYILLSICIYMQATTCASSPIQNSVINMPHRILELQITADEQRHDASYTNTIASLARAHEFTVTFDLRTMDKEESLSPLLFALYLHKYDLAKIITEKFPHYTDITDSRDNTAMHYLVKSNNDMPDESVIPHDLTMIFAHQINIPNINTHTPIFKTCDPRGLIMLYMMGADLNRRTITHACPRLWQFDRMLATLHHLGFNDLFLATTFDYNLSTIIEVSAELAPEIQEIMHTQANCQKTEQLGSSSFINALTMREQFGRHTKRELRTRALLLEQSTKRTEHPLDSCATSSKRTCTS